MLTTRDRVSYAHILTHVRPRFTLYISFFKAEMSTVECGVITGSRATMMSALRPVVPDSGAGGIISRHAAMQLKPGSVQSCSYYTQNYLLRYQYSIFVPIFPFTTQSFSESTIITWKWRLDDVNYKLKIQFHIQVICQDLKILLHFWVLRLWFTEMQHRLQSQIFNNCTFIAYNQPNAHHIKWNRKIRERSCILLVTAQTCHLSPHSTPHTHTALLK